MSRDCPCPRPEQPIRRSPESWVALHQKSNASNIQFTDSTACQPHVVISIGNESVTALIDTGAVRSYIGDRVVELCKTYKFPQATASTHLARMANGEITEIKESYQINFRIGSKQYQEVIHYLPGLPTEMVLGMDLLGKLKFKLDLGSDLITVEGYTLPKEQDLVSCRLLSKPNQSTHSPKTPLTLAAKEESCIQITKTAFKPFSVPESRPVHRTENRPTLKSDDSDFRFHRCE